VEAAAQAIDTTAYETVTTLHRLNEWAALAREAGLLAFDTETDSLDAHGAALVGFSLAVEPGKAAYVPLRHRGDTDLFGGGLLPVRSRRRRRWRPYARSWRTARSSRSGRT
jgi:DNA polymerase-1